MRLIENAIVVFDWLVRFLAVVVGVLLLSTVFLVVADVLGRYFFQSPIGWVFELTEHFLVAIPFLGMAWLVRRSGHVSIDIVVQQLSPRLQSRVNAFTSLVASCTCAVATYWAAETTRDHFVRGIDTYGIYPIPKYLLIALIALGLGLTTIEFARKAYEDYFALRTEE